MCPIIQKIGVKLYLKFFLVFILFLRVGVILSQAVSDKPRIMIDLSSPPLGSLHATLLGVNNPMTDLPLRTEYNSGVFSNQFYEAAQKLGIKCFRFPGGNNSGSYHWQLGIGSPENRPPGFNGSTGASAPDYYAFGFREFMDFEEEIGGCKPVICINFGTGSAREASAWVEFANNYPGTDPNGDGIDQAQIRADWGHPQVYGIRLWEIGNELGGKYKHMFSWHFGQLEGGGENYSRTVTNYIFGGSQWQYYEMETRQAGQRVVKNNDWTPKACQSNGQKHQIFYVKYPPLAKDSLYLGVWQDTLTVDQWQLTDNLKKHTGTDKVFTLDTLTGRIDFGDGIQGAIPPAGSEIRVIYKSSHKDGLVDFYEMMKAVDNTINIGVPFHDETFFQEVKEAGFSELPFDFIVDHRYEPGRAEQLENEHWQLMWTAFNQETLMHQHRDNLDVWFQGKKKIKIGVTEYNLVYHLYGRESSNNPWYQGDQLDYFGRSLDNGLYLAGAFMSYVRSAGQTGLEVLNVHALVPDSNEAVAGWPLTSLIGPYPHDYFNPSGLVYSLFSPSKGYFILQPEMNYIPQYRLKPPEGREKILSRVTATDSVNLSYLDALATCSEKGDTICLFVLNRASGLVEAKEEYSDITADIVFQNCSDLTNLKVFELNAENLWTINSHFNPEKVSTAFILEQTFTDSLVYTFPAHSLTMIMGTGTSSELRGDQQGQPSDSFVLYQNYPNPFNAVTTISYYIPSCTQVTISVFNVWGRQVTNPVNENQKRGSYSVIWNSDKLSSGLYFFQLKTDYGCIVRKALVLK